MINNYNGVDGDCVYDDSEDYDSQVIIHYIEGTPDNNEEVYKLGRGLHDIKVPDIMKFSLVQRCGGFVL